MVKESLPLHTILFAEPDEPHRELFALNLALKYTIYAPKSLTEIWRLIDNHPPLSALVTASFFWEISAEELISEVRLRYEDLPVVIFTNNPKILLEGTTLERVEIVDKLSGDIGIENTLTRLLR